MYSARPVTVIAVYMGVYILVTALSLPGAAVMTLAGGALFGMLPGTIVYVNAGKELGEIEKLSGILSPGVILSFVLLGLFPLIAKKTVGWIRSHKETEVEQ